MRGRPNANIPCSHCTAIPTFYVRELVPGAKGKVNRSIAGQYRLCHDCLRKCEKMQAIVTVIPSKGWRDKIVVVKAKTFGVLKGKV